MDAPDIIDVLSPLVSGAAYEVGSSIDGEVIYVVRDLSLTTGPVNDDDPVDVSVSLSVLDVASQ